MKKLILLTSMLLGVTLVSCGPQVDPPVDEDEKKETPLSEKEIDDIISNISDYTKDVIGLESSSIDEDKIKDEKSTQNTKMALYLDNVLIEETELKSKEGTKSYIVQTTMDDKNVTRITYYGEGSSNNGVLVAPLEELSQEDMDALYSLTMADQFIAYAYELLKNENSERTDSATGEIFKTIFDNSASGSKLGEEITISLIMNMTNIYIRPSEKATHTETTVNNDSLELHLKGGVLDSLKHEYTETRRIKEGDESETISKNNSESAENYFTYGEKVAYSGTLLKAEDIIVEK